MKKNTLAFIAAFGALAATSAWAHSGDSVINFYPLGDTYYATGEKVGPGEWWAVGWSADGVFEGIKADATPIDPNDKVLKKFRVYVGLVSGITFQIPYQIAPTTGEYHVLVLDTRGADGEPSAANAEGAPAVVNGSHLASGGLAVSSAGAGSVSGGVEALPVSGSYAVDTSSLVNGEVAKITKFDVNGKDVSIKVENLLPSVVYTVVYGDSLENIKTAEYTVPRDGLKTTVSFQLTAEDAKFFKLGVK